jgi:hypothetical protein
MSDNSAHLAQPPLTKPVSPRCCCITYAAASGSFWPSYCRDGTPPERAGPRSALLVPLQP